MQRGFIQIPILIAIIVAAILGGGAYVAYEVAKPSQNASPKTLETDQATSTQVTSEIEKLKQEVSDLRKLSSSKTQTIESPSVPKKQVVETPPIKKGVALSNAEIIKRVKPATVFIETSLGSGSGMIFDSSGYILTNAHVVGKSSSATIKLSDGKSYKASVVGKDEIIDLAVLKIDGTNLPIVSFGNSDDIRQGDDVFTLGYPFGIGGDVSFKEGTVSRKVNGADQTYIETSADIHPGNSGGPLVTKYGEVVGVNTMAYGESIGGVSVGETIKFAISINTAKNLIPELKSGKMVIDPAAVKQDEYTDFNNFKSDFLAILQADISGIDLLGDAETQYVSGSYFSANSKALEAIAVYDSAIKQLQKLSIPNIPFSTTISELVQMYIKKFGYSKTLATYSQYIYEAWIASGSESSKLDYTLSIQAERTKVMNESTNFYNNQFEPKFKEYTDKVNAYFK